MNSGACFLLDNSSKRTHTDEVVFSQASEPHALCFTACPTYCHLLAKTGDPKVKAMTTVHPYLMYPAIISKALTEDITT